MAFQIMQPHYLREALYYLGLICLLIFAFFISYSMNFFHIFRFDPKVLDVLLSEVVLLNTRTELFLRFFRRRAVVSHNTVEMID